MSSSVTMVSAASASTAATSALVKTANGEYTAASVAKDPKDAAKLGLIREQDGNYGTQSASQVSATPATKSTSATLSVLTTLTLGGA